MILYHSMTVQDFRERARALFPLLDVTNIGDFMHTIGYSRANASRSFYEDGVGARSVVILRLLERLKRHDIELLISENKQLRGKNYGNLPNRKD